MIPARDRLLWVLGLVLGLICAASNVTRGDDVPVLPRDEPPVPALPGELTPPLPKTIASVSDEPADANAPGGDRRGQKRRGKEMTPEQEQKILEFVTVQHPELATLLQRLREKDSQQYQVAMNDLRPTVEKLSRLQAKHPKRYEAEVENWKAQSRIRLLRARRSLQPDGVPETELRTWLDREVDARLKILKLERIEMAERLAKLDDEIRETEQNRKNDVDRELQRSLKKTRARPTSPRSKPATRRNSPTPVAPELGNPEEK